jgi:hypothetical protein
MQSINKINARRLLTQTNKRVTSSDFAVLERQNKCPNLVLSLLQY